MSASPPARLRLSHRSIPWLLCALAAAAWLVRVEGEPDAPQAWGRYGYPQFVLALGLTALAGTGIVVSLARPQNRRRAVLRALATWLGLTAAFGAWEALAHVLPPRRNPFYHFNEGGVAAGNPSAAEIPFRRPAHLDWTGPTYGDVPEWSSGDPPLREVTFRTDQDGFRNPVDRTRADLVFVGDSFTEAGSVNAADTFAERLGSAEVGVRNLGLSAIGPQAELAILREYGLACEPRVVVWQVFEGNDLENALRHEQRMALLRDGRDVRDTFAEFRNPAWMQRSPTYRLFDRCVPRERWWPGGTFRSADGSRHEVRFGYWPLREDHVPHVHPGWPAMAAALTDGATLLREKGIRLVVLYVPMKMTVLGGAVEFDVWTRGIMAADWDGTWALVPGDQTLGAAVARVCDEQSVPFVDVTAELRAATRGGELVYDPTDTHLSPRGHEIVAQRLSLAVRPLLGGR